MPEITIDGHTLTASSTIINVLKLLRDQRDHWRNEAIEAKQELAELQRLVDGGLMTYDSNHG